MSIEYKLIKPFPKHLKHMEDETLNFMNNSSLVESASFVTTVLGFSEEDFRKHFSIVINKEE